jgi:hypothetical protein
MGFEQRHSGYERSINMASLSIVPWFGRLTQRVRRPDWLRERPDLHTLGVNPARLPPFVQECAVALRYLDLLSPLAWDRFPERNLVWQPTPIPYAALAAACLIKLDQQLVSMGRLRQYLVEQPALLWLCGFPFQAAPSQPCGFDPDASLPTARHLTRMLRELPDVALQFLLDSSVTLLQTELAACGVRLGECIAMDTKHVIAWVKENNPKTYVSNRYDKTQQPTGDPDCKLGCKRRHNQRAPGTDGQAAPPTPIHNPHPAKTVEVGEFYWGYASGVVATKVPDWGEFVLAELTQPFNQPDVAYFQPLMTATERRLGFRPPYAAFDAAFDAFYIYEYFDQPLTQAPDATRGFAAVPFSERGGHKLRFDAEGQPLCQADLTMPLRYTFRNKTTRVEHERGRYVCPLLWPEKSADPCPIAHKQWAKGGCTTTIATSVGARLRYQLDRDSQTYKDVYKQRTATERINSQAVELGIERPRLRNGQAVAHLNTLIYILINLRTLQRIRQRKAHRIGEPSENA